MAAESLSTTGLAESEAQHRGCCEWNGWREEGSSGMKGGQRGERRVRADLAVVIGLVKDLGFTLSKRKPLAD